MVAARRALGTGPAPLGRPDALCVKRRPEAGAGQRSEPGNGANAQVLAASANTAPLS
jgi:hypothetical protein